MNRADRIRSRNLLAVERHIKRIRNAIIQRQKMWANKPLITPMHYRRGGVAWDIKF